MKSPEKIIEDAVGELYRGYYFLREAKQYQTEYDAMGTLINMLSKDRQHIRATYKIEI